MPRTSFATSAYGKNLKKLCIFTAILSSMPGAISIAATPWIATYHYNNLRTGWNDRETTLTPANVGNLQLQQTVALDEQVDAQPLFVPAVTIAGGKHDVVYVATANATIYAIDAMTGAILLQQNFGPPVPQAVLPGSCGSNSAVVGITSTPVIDAASSTLYALSYTYENSTQAYSLHALDLSTLKDKVTPAVVQATATLSDGSNWIFEPAYSRQRAGLLEANGNIYAGFASFCDLAANNSRGWLLGWQAGSLAALAANQLNNRLVPAQSPNDYFLTSIWMSGYGIAADKAGNLYFATSNSDPSGTTYNPTHNLSESILKMSADLTKVMNYFTPSGSLGVDYLDETDGDFGSGGVLLLPEQHGRLFLATAAGKSGQMFLLNRNNLGGYDDPNQVLGTYSIASCLCGESYFTGWDGIGRVVSSGGNQIIVWRVQTSPDAALVEESTSAALPASVQDPGFFTSVSSSGTSSAIVWAVGRPTSRSPADVMLYAFAPQAAAQGNSGWLFSAVAGTWPNTDGNANIVPVVVNGQVYVASYKELAIFGLPSARAVGKPKGAAAFIPATPSPAPRLPPGAHEIYGTIKTVAGAEVTLSTRTGNLVPVDAADAVDRHLSVGLQVGEPVTVFGSYRLSGILHATSVFRAKSSPTGWPPDR
jgi:hypothetical protein